MRLSAALPVDPEYFLLSARDKGASEIHATRGGRRTFGAPLARRVSFESRAACTFRSLVCLSTKEGTTRSLLCLEAATSVVRRAVKH